MGILPSPKTNEKPAATAKRKSLPMDFANLKPLNPSGAMGFSKFRDNETDSPKNGNNRTVGRTTDDMDSDEEEVISERQIKEEDIDPEDSKVTLSPEDVKRQGELAEGVQKIKVGAPVERYPFLKLSDVFNSTQLKRQHSSDPLNAARKSPASNTPTAGSTPPKSTGFEQGPPPLLTSASYEPIFRPSEDAIVGSPLKRARASVSGADDDILRRSGLGSSMLSADIMGRIEQDQIKREHDEEEEL